ncbi:NAD(P)-dependent oxidoreductase [Aquipuribacter nitratireducens]|uniref:NAD(P)-dependent oxidoreductase n=1 Tax=Aquipuribacter nitratireducens TaxID=650104 RepID=A0ABW0GNN3_9MICO
MSTASTASTASVPVAVCGLGRMGSRMAARLAAAGHPTAVWNRSPGPAEQLAGSHDVRVAATPAAAADGADVVLTMLTDGPALLAVLDGPDGVLAGAGSGTVVVDCSTTGREHALEAAQRCRAAGVDMLDSPVSGSTAVAEAGRLGLMVGGDADVLERARPVLDAVAATVVHVGAQGSGASAKVAVNALLHTFSTALAETLVTAEAGGVARDRLLDVLAAGVLANTFLAYKREAFLAPDTAPVAFDLRTATKDLALADAATEEAGLRSSLVRRAHELHTRALADGLGDRDMVAMSTWFASRVRTDAPTPQETAVSATSEGT